MRLWSIHPKYLDPKGLVALWREGLLAQAVLYGRTVGYRNHPQLTRFKKHVTPLLAINTYLYGVLDESKKRGYQFDEDKLDKSQTDIKIDVTEGQLKYEYIFLCEKLKARNIAKWKQLNEEKKVETHPFFERVEGKVEPWEKVK